MRISQRLRDAVKTSGVHQYRLARRARMDRSVLSCWMNDITPVRPGDQRVLRLGALLGVPAGECFEEPTAGAQDGDGLEIQPMTR